MSTPQQAIQADWENREFVETISTGIKRITEFLNNFGNNFVCCSLLSSCSSMYLPRDLEMSTRYRLAVLNEKLTSLERSLEFMEAKVCWYFFELSKRFLTYLCFGLLGPKDSEWRLLKHTHSRAEEGNYAENRRWCWHGDTKDIYDVCFWRCREQFICHQDHLSWNWRDLKMEMHHMWCVMI